MDGNVMIGAQMDTRPLTKSLSELRAKIQYTFKGVDAKELSAAVKQVSSEIKQAERVAQQAQLALDALMSGEATPRSVQALEKELVVAEKQLNKMSRGYQKMLDEVAKYEGSAGLPAHLYPESQKYDEAIAALQRYEKEFEAADLKVQQLHADIDALKQNPELTPEAQHYNRTLVQTNARLTELREREAELGREVEKNRVKHELSSKSAIAGLQRVEHRISRLAKRVLFFSLITMALRHFRNYLTTLIQGDAELSASLAQVKGALASSFGMIWSAVLPAIRAMVNWLAKATAYIAAFISWLTGKSFKQGQSAFESANKASAGVAGNTKKIGKAAKKAAKEAQRMLLPFDQMNVLSKDAADSGGGGGGGAGGGGAGGLGGITYPTDEVMAKFEKFKDLIFLIGAGLAAWKLSKVLAPFTTLTKGPLFLALTSIVLGIFELIDGIRSIVKEGPNVENVCSVVAGALLVIGGVLTFITGPIGLVVSAIGLLVLGFKNLYKNNKSFKKWVDTIGKLFKEKKFKELGKHIITGIWKGITSTIKKFGSWAKKHILDPIIKGIKKVFKISSPAKAMLDIGKQIILGVLEGMLEPFKKIGSWVKDNVLTPLKEAFSGDGNNEGFLVNIETKFEDTKDSLKQKWDNIKEGISETWANIKSKFEDTKEKLKQKWEDIKSGITETWANIKSKFEDTKESLSTKWNNITSNLNNLWVTIQSKFTDTKESLQTKWNGITAGIADKTATITTAVKEAAAGALDKVKSVFSYGGKTVSATIKTAVTGVKVKTLQKLSTALGKIKWGNKTLNAAINLKATVGSAYNAAARKINGLIDKLPKAVRPSWRLPTLAQGAVIPANKEFLAVLGDQKRGVNIETPLSTMVQAFNQALQANGVGGPTSVNVYLQGDAKQLFKVVRVEANNYTQSTGKAAFNL